MMNGNPGDWLSDAARRAGIWAAPTHRRPFGAWFGLSSGLAWDSGLFFYWTVESCISWRSPYRVTPVLLNQVRMAVKETLFKIQESVEKFLLDPKVLRYIGLYTVLLIDKWTKQDLPTSYIVNGCLCMYGLHLFKLAGLCLGSSHGFFLILSKHLRDILAWSLWIVRQCFVLWKR